MEALIIICSRKADILGADDVQIGPSAQQPAKDVVIQVFVGSQAEHGHEDLSGLRRANNRSRRPCSGARRSFSWRTRSLARCRSPR